MFLMARVSLKREERGAKARSIKLPFQVPSNVRAERSVIVGLSYAAQLHWPGCGGWSVRRAGHRALPAGPASAGSVSRDADASRLYPTKVITFGWRARTPTLLADPSVRCHWRLALNRLPGPRQRVGNRPRANTREPIQSPTILLLYIFYN